MKLPTLRQLMEFTEQWSVYEHPVAEPMFIAGPPGSGKTTLAVLRAQFLVNDGQRVMVVTRNRMLAAVAKRLGQDSTFEASTMHSLVASDHYSRFKETLPEVARYRPNWDVLMERYADRGCAPRYDHLIVDEGQNLPPRFFEWARDFGGRTLSVFADEHQATCEQTSTLADISSSGRLGTPIRLTMNHRNTPEIAAVAEHFHRSKKLPPAVVQRATSGDLPRLIKVSTWAALADVVATRLTNRREAIGVIVHKKVDAERLRGLLTKRLSDSDRVDCYTSDSPSGVEASIAVFDPGITVLTGEAVIGLEFETAYLVDVDRSLPCATEAQARRMYMLCARARTSLMIVDGLPDLGNKELAALPDESLLAR